MKRLIGTLMLAALSAQAGYCAGSAMEQLGAASGGDAKIDYNPVIIVQEVDSTAETVYAKIMFKGLPPTTGRKIRSHPFMAPEYGNKPLNVNLEPLDKSAGDRLKDLAGATAFKKLKNLFEEGVPATKDDLTGWYAGRSVYNTDDAAENHFVGALLAGREVPVNLNGGPLFEGEKMFEVILPVSDAPDYYDNMSTSTAAGLLGKIDKYPYGFTMKFPGARAMRENSSHKSWVEERKARGYIVEHMEQYDKKTGKKRIEVYSYYFKNVTPEK